MSLADGEPKFLGTESTSKTIPPSPSRENPAGVYPMSSPTPATPYSIPGTGGSSRTSKFGLGNPFLFAARLDALERSLTDVIEVVEKETSSDAEGQMGHEDKMLLHKFKGWRQELSVIRSNRIGVPQQEIRSVKSSQSEITPGGLFAD